MPRFEARLMFSRKSASASNRENMPTQHARNYQNAPSPIQNCVLNNKRGEVQYKKRTARTNHR